MAKPKSAAAATPTRSEPSASFAVDGTPWIVGESYFIRTVTMHLVGRLVGVYAQELLLESASWVADSGRFHDALAKGTLGEVEPFVGPVIVGRGSIVDATTWSHPLPTNQK